MVKLPYENVSANYDVDGQKAEEAAETVTVGYDEESGLLRLGFTVDRENNDFHDYSYSFAPGDLLKAVGEALNHPDE